MCSIFQEISSVRKSHQLFVYSEKQEFIDHHLFIQVLCSTSRASFKAYAYILRVLNDVYLCSDVYIFGSHNLLSQMSPMQ